MKIDSYKLKRILFAAAILYTVPALGQAPADPLAQARSLLEAGTGGRAEVGS